jgi:uncharacterized protein (TIGR02646 family)
MAAAAVFYLTYDPTAPKAKCYPFKEYKGYDVTLTLSTLFCNKCAYCESDLGDTLEVEHFRPKGGVAGERLHKGYWWLAHRWGNLLPSCPPCNQKRRQHLVTETMTVEELTKLMAKRARESHGKANQFPVSGIRAFCEADDIEAERPDLIDPTSEDPASFLRWSRAGDFSVVLSTDDANGSKRGLATIGTFALNRVRLVQSRTRILNELRFHASEIKKDLKRDCQSGGARTEHVDRALERVAVLRRLHEPDQPYSAMVKAYIDELVEELRASIGP